MKTLFIATTMMFVSGGAFAAANDQQNDLIYGSDPAGNASVGEPYVQMSQKNSAQEDDLIHGYRPVKASVGTQLAAGTGHNNQEQQDMSHTIHGH